MLFRSALRAGDNRVRTHILKHNEPDSVFAYQRVNETETLTVILNLSSQHLEVHISDDSIQLARENRRHELKGGGYVIIA